MPDVELRLTINVNEKKLIINRFLFVYLQSIINLKDNCFISFYNSTIQITFLIWYCICDSFQLVLCGYVIIVE